MYAALSTFTGRLRAQAAHTGLIAPLIDLIGEYSLEVLGDNSGFYGPCLGFVACPVLYTDSFRFWGNRWCVGRFGWKALLALNGKVSYDDGYEMIGGTVRAEALGESAKLVPYVWAHSQRKWWETCHGKLIEDASFDILHKQTMQRISVQQ